MITLKKMREMIEKSENPLIFFDDDPDGLCSYLLIRRYFGKGKGIVLKSSPRLDVSYVEKVKKYSPDLVLVLDKPIIDQEFVDKVNVPIIWIDHHPIVGIKGVRYYNPRFRDKRDNRCTSYWCWRLTKRGLWIAAIGVVADWQQLPFLKKFSKEYPNLLDIRVKEEGKILFESKLGELIRVFSFILKGRIGDVNEDIERLVRVEGPYEILENKSEEGKLINRKVKAVNRMYNELLNEAMKIDKNKKVVVFLYPSSKWSFTGELANELLYRYRNKVIIVGREKNGVVRMSLRSPEGGIILPPAIKKILKEIEGHGGGHDHAAGASVKMRDFKEFVSRIEEEVK